MIIDARHELPRTPIDCDLCIVGGGPAGIALARELDNGHRSIVLLESGGLKHERDAQALLSGDVDGTYPPLQSTRMAALGGSAHVWAGWCRPLDPVDFEPRDGDPNSGWPFDRAELDPYYARAHDLLDLGEFDYTPQRRESAIATDGFTPVLFRRTTLAFPGRYVPELRASSSIRAFIHASALRIVQDADGRRAQSVKAASAPGREFEIRPRTLVLAAGGIENARLLLLSNAGSRRVGQHFTEHVFVEAAGFVPSDAPRPIAQHVVRDGWSAARTLLRREGLLNGALYLQPSYESDAAFADERVESLLEAWDMLRGRAVPYQLMQKVLRAAAAPRLALRALGHRLAPGRSPVRWRLRGLFECTSSPGNRVELAERQDVLGRRMTRLHWRIEDADVRSIIRTHTLLDTSLRRAGAGHLDLPPQDVDAWHSALRPALHHLGTTRMHVDPTQGVVDADCRMHGSENVYIAGGSVFPTGGYANPTLTILALALRLAGHLQAREQ